jgi:pterin-4a-carbinolamine dehydratase
MQNMNNWHVGHPEDSRKILSRSFPVTAPSDAYSKAVSILKVADEAQYVPENLQLSISSENVLVVLHAFSKGNVEEDDYALAKKIDAIISTAAG